MQFPNPPLIAALAATVAARLTHGDVRDYAHGAASVGFAAWAWLELAEGDNWFRRGLGAVGLVWVVIRVA